MDALWDEKRGITWEEHMSSRLNNFLDKHPQYYNTVEELLTGGVKRTAYMTKDNFRLLVPITDKIKDTDQVTSERLEYHRILTESEKEAGLKGKRLKKNIGQLDRSKDKNKFKNFTRFFKDISSYYRYFKFENIS